MLVFEPSHFKIIIKVRLASFEKFLSGEKIPNFSSPEPASILYNLYREHSFYKWQKSFYFFTLVFICDLFLSFPKARFQVTSGKVKFFQNFMPCMLANWGAAHQLLWGCAQSIPRQEDPEHRGPWGHLNGGGGGEIPGTISPVRLRS